MNIIVFLKFVLFDVYEWFSLVWNACLTFLGGS
jgi:hypothetical protein